MPIYEYECLQCGVRFDKLQRLGAPAPETYPNGHRQVVRHLSQPTIIFKGSGFYVTDNGRNGGSKSTPRKSKAGSKHPSSTEGAKGDS